MNKKQLWERKLAQRNKKLTEAYDDNVTAKTADEKQVSASASTRSTRTYNYEDVEFEFGARKGFGTYRWMNRPWQRFDFASALQKAMIDAGVDEEFARECIEKSGSLRSAVAYFANNYETEKQLKESDMMNESDDKQNDDHKTIRENDCDRLALTQYEGGEPVYFTTSDKELEDWLNADPEHSWFPVDLNPEDDDDEDLEDEENKVYQIKYWLTEEDREEGFSDIFIDSFDSKQEAIMTAKKMVDRGDVASVEVFDAEDVTEQPIYFYDGDETDLDESAQKDRKELNYLLRKEKVTSLDKYERHRLQELIQMYGRLDEQSHEDINEEKELKEARGAGKGQKLDKYYRMVVNLYKDNLSKEEIERLKKARAEVEKFEPKSEYEKRDKKNLLDQIARTLEDGTLKEALVEYDPAKWEPEDIELHKSINWKERNYEDFPVEGDTIETEVILYSLHKSPRARMVTAQKYLRANPIYPPYYEAKEVPFKDEDEGGVVGGMFDGNKHNKTMIMDRYETANLNYYLSI